MTRHLQNMAQEQQGTVCDHDFQEFFHLVRLCRLANLASKFNRCTKTQAHRKLLNLPPP